jgi:DnaJ-class molecular chaperone
MNLHEYAENLTVTCPSCEGTIVRRALCRDCQGSGRRALVNVLDERTEQDEEG